MVELDTLQKRFVNSSGSTSMFYHCELIDTLRSDVLVETLSPDFGGDLTGVDAIVNAGVDVFAHNMETVRSLTPYVDHSFKLPSCSPCIVMSEIAVLPMTSP